MSLKLELHVQATQDQQPARAWFNHPELSGQQIDSCFSHGAVWLQADHKPIRIYDPNAAVNQGHWLHLYCNQSTLTPCPYQAELVEDFGSFSIWDKPAGMLSQGSKWGDHWTLQRWIHHQVWPERKCLITHRLDRFTRGLMIVAHDEKINQQFHRAFERREVSKTYRAIVSGSMAAGDRLALTTAIDGKPASTHIRVLAGNDRHSLLEIIPATGRKHQIRIHLAEIGHPIINDRQYGQPPHSGDLMLQACGLSFSHPQDGQSITVKLAGDRLLSLV
ncbi:MAG: RNA pseudouridine synthase [Gammaproteobacteria bacterium]|nr:RNA pseudouridine synthase [Gammaproteobacteria bacterium]